MPTQESFAAYYAAMDEDDLLRLSSDVVSLVPEARTALRSEMEGRGLSTEGIDWNAQLAPTRAEGTLDRFIRNILIFGACDLLYIIAAGLVAANTSGVDYEKVIGSVTGGLFSLSIALATVTTKSRIPESKKTIWIIGLVVPLFLFLFVFFRRQ